jgi:hypothetical protein
MDRDPAIHVKQSDLLQICKEEGITFPEDFVSAVMAKASKIKLNNRVIVVAKSKATTKAARTAATSDNVVAQFNSVYIGTLRNHDRRIMPIHKGTKQYLALKEVATAAHNFAKDYKIKSLTDAFKIYVGLGIILLGKNRVTIYRMKGIDYKIRDRHENMEILKWVHPMDTELAHVAWDRSLKNFHNLSMELNQDQLSHIARASQEAKEAKADIHDWMDAQFDKWTFMDSMPEFTQLHGDNAKLAYTRYMAKKGQEYTNDAEKKHFETVKNEKKIPIKGQKRQRGQG